MIAETDSPEAVAAKTPTGSRIRIFKLIAVLLGFVFALAVTEAGLRMIEQTRTPQTPDVISDPVLGIRVAANASGHDARGFRNVSAPAHADVVAIGDSQTWGVNAQATDAWPQQLARLSGRSVYNMAVGGYGPDQYLILSKQALQLSPKTIVVGLYFGNDLYDAYAWAYRQNAFADLRLENAGNDLSTDTVQARAAALWDEEKNFHYSYGRRSAKGWSIWLREHTAIGRLLNRNGWWLGASDIDYQIDQEWARAYPDHAVVCDQKNIRTVLTTAYRLTAVDLDDPHIADGLRITKVVLGRIRQQTEGHANLIVMMIPAKELVYADVMRRNGPLNGTYARATEMETKARNDMKSWCADNRVTCIDALPAMQTALAQGRQLYPTSAESHPIAAGYGVIASVVNDALKDLPR